MPALAQDDDRVTCVSCRFRYPSIRGFCPVCGEPAPSAPDPALGPRPVATKAQRKTSASIGPVLRAAMAGQLRKPLFAAAAMLTIVCVVVFIRVRSPQVKATNPVPLVASSSPETSGQAGSAPDQAADPGNLQPRVTTPTAMSAAKTAEARKPSNDPAELWKQVRRGNTRAEIMLAKLYLYGNGVAQSCEQAHLLLSAAAKKRSEEAGRLLSGPYALKCR